MLNHLDNYYLSLPEAEQNCLLFARKFLLGLSSEITEHYKYGGPFFHYRGKQFCYLAYSRTRRKTYAGFIYGNSLKHPKLLSEGRSQVKVFYFDPEKDIDIRSFTEIVKLACGSR